MRLVVCAVSVAFSLIAAPARALNQPNGAPVPGPPGCHAGKPTGLAAMFACQCLAPATGCNIGDPCVSPSQCDDGRRGTCESTLYHTFNDNTCIPSNVSGIDPVAKASTTPETFHPTCGLTFTVATRGDARFKDAFGWYNVTGQKPTPSELHVMLDCNAADGAKVTLDVRSDPAYRGGDVAFFLISPESANKDGTCAGGDCCASLARAQAGQGFIYYSEKAFNPDAMGFIHLLIYDSSLTQNKFYFAWEDRFGGQDNQFTDLVTSVEGIECSGGGTPCDTGMKGACAAGINTCKNGVVTCNGLVAAETEKCDGVDNDCDGTVDDGAACPDAREVCVNGRCVPHCARASEFACPHDLACDGQSGVCIEPGCVMVSCPADTICKGGRCVGPCDDIVCPRGSTCRGGECVQPCKDRDCPVGKTCVEGLCIAACTQCGGLTCPMGQLCDPQTGGCYDPSCPNGCPSGTYCEAGQCKDVCAGARCPAGQVCENGACGLPTSSLPGDDPDGGAGGGGGGGRDRTGGCGCSDPTGPQQAGSALLLGLVLLGLRRRRD